MVCWLIADASFDVCVVGAGPAGSVAANKLAQLGHRVCLVERSRFPRPHVGESLTKGIWPIAEAIGIDEELRQAAFLRAGQKLVRWANAEAERLSARQSGTTLLVDRGDFDALLLRSAAASGVSVRQPVNVRRTFFDGTAWKIELERGNSASFGIGADYLVDATGRANFLRGERERTFPRTLALCGYVQPDCFHDTTLVEALAESWCWGAPIPSGLFSVMVFLDFHAAKVRLCEGVEKFWRSQLASSELFKDFAQAPIVGQLFGRDATAFRAINPISSHFIRVGETSFSLDPLSSTGVEKAMQSGLNAAIVLHTMISRPERRSLCAQFYRDRQKQTVSTHIGFSKNFYASVRRFADRSFWRVRSGSPAREEGEAGAAPKPFSSVELKLNTCLRISERTLMLDEPCIVGDEICLRTALRHPNLGRYVAFVDGVEIGPLVSMVRSGVSIAGLLERLSDKIPEEQAKRICLWFLENGILEPISKRGFMLPAFDVLGTADR
jgi:flavin-dependent dehydrogenase